MSCNPTSKKKDVIQYKDGRQLLNVNNVNKEGEVIETPVVRKIAPDSIHIGEEFVAKIFLLEKDQQIVNAFIECTTTHNLSVDTVTNEITGCEKPLYIRNDTILIGFRPSKLGIKQFPEITILTKDQENVFRILPYSFNYHVVE